MDIILPVHVPPARMDIILPVHVPPAGMECFDIEGEKNNKCVQHIFSPSVY